MKEKKSKIDYGCLLIISLAIFNLLLYLYGDRFFKRVDTNPYSEGSHGSYTIICENGFMYKSIYRGGTIQLCNSDGTFVRCGQSPY